jgi:hypothetical protein
MARSKQQIIDDIKAHIQKRGGSFGAWYVSTTKDARTRLFGEHHVKQKGDRWIRRKAGSSETAREVAEHLVRTLATDGKADGDASADMVYAYRKAPHTRP